MSTYRYAKGDQPLDGYTIEYGLGRGGFGEVYFARSDSGREVALKLIQNHEDIELRGISHCMNLKSPHLVTIFDVRRGKNGVPWVIMEHVSGPSLRELLDESGAENGIGREQALYFIRELIKGLRYLHDAGVVHRDLKPHNIFFEDGTVKIGDYSLSKAISTSHRSGHTTTVGSVHYMAPEIGEGKYNNAVDIYALGVILYEMLTGQPPYTGESVGEVLIKHLSGKPDVSHLDEPFASVISKAMQRRPEDRFQSVDEMLFALCPDDHSSYLPAPASLSMIGDRAVAKRRESALANRARPADESKFVYAKAVQPETLIPYASLVDTNPETDSQPFERPGLPRPNSPFRKLLNQIGCWWSPSNQQLRKASGSTPLDDVGLGLRMVCAVMASFVVVGSVSSVIGLTDGSVVIAILGLPLLGGLLTWLFLQFLPRSRFIVWSIISRIMSTVLIAFTGLMFGAFMHEALDIRFDEEHFAGLVFLGLLVDWRCYISAVRYPRVGLLRTLFAAAVYCGITMMVEELDSVCLLLTAMVIVVTLTIQLLAPQYRPPQEKKRIERPAGNQQTSDSNWRISMKETRMESESFVLQENM